MNSLKCRPKTLRFSLCILSPLVFSGCYDPQVGAGHRLIQLGADVCVSARETRRFDIDYLGIDGRTPLSSCLDIIAKRSVGQLYISNHRLTTHDVELLSTIRGVEKLSLLNVLLDQDQLPNWPTLKSIRVVGGNITADAVASLSAPELTEVFLREIPITDDCLLKLASIHHLTACDVSHTAVSRDLAKSIIALPQLERCALAGLGLTDEDLQFVSPLIHNLDVSDNPIGDRGVELLSRREFRTLKLSGTQISDKSIPILVSMYPLTTLARSLDVSHSKISTAGVIDLGTKLPGVVITISRSQKLPGTNVPDNLRYDQ